MKNNTQRLKTKAQVHNVSQNLPLNEQNSQHNTKIDFFNDSKSQNCNFHVQSETQKIANNTFHSHDD